MIALLSTTVGYHAHGNKRAEEHQRSHGAVEPQKLEAYAAAHHSVAKKAYHVNKLFAEKGTRGGKASHLERTRGALHSLEEALDNLDEERTEDDVAAACMELAVAMDNAFPYHGSEHAKVAAAFAKQYSGEDTDTNTVGAMMSCHDAGYPAAAAKQGYPSTTTISTEGFQVLNPAEKLGKGHEAESIKEAVGKGMSELAHGKEAVYGISATQLGPPGTDITEQAATAAGVAFTNDQDYGKLAEAADFAYMADGFGTDASFGGGYKCHLLACFLEFFEYGGIEANIFGAKNGQPGDVPKEWASFMAMQAGFAYFVVNSKLTAVGAVSMFGSDSVATSGNPFPKEGDPPAGAMPAFGRVAAKVAQLGVPKTTAETTLCGLIDEVDSTCKAAHSGIAHVCTE